MYDKNRCLESATQTHREAVLRLWPKLEYDYAINNTRNVQTRFTHITSTCHVTRFTRSFECCQYRSGCTFVLSRSLSALVMLCNKKQSQNSVTKYASMITVLSHLILFISIILYRFNTLLYISCFQVLLNFACLQLHKYFCNLNLNYIHCSCCYDAFYYLWSSIAGSCGFNFSKKYNTIFVNTIIEYNTSINVVLLIQDTSL